MENKLYMPMSGEEIKSFSPNANIIVYSDLYKYDRLPNLPCVILYEIAKGNGHWICLLETPEGIEHFDSYGLYPDEEFKFIPEDVKKILNENHTYLVNLLLNSGEQINYQPIKFQGGGRIATCGRHCCTRLLFPNHTTKQYADMMEYTSNILNKSPDEIVSLLI